MILQTDPALPEVIHSFGCYFTSCLFHAEKRTGKSFAADEVLAIFEAAKKAGFIGDDCYVDDPIGLLRLAGVRVSGVVKAGISVLPGDRGFELLHFHREADSPTGMGNVVHDHFVAGDGAGAVAFDPLGDSNTVKYGFLQNKRIFV